MTTSLLAVVEAAAPEDAPPEESPDDELLADVQALNTSAEAATPATQTARSRVLLAFIAVTPIDK
jgi:hypothetical protein